MAKRESGIMATVRLFVPVDKKDTRSQIAVSQAMLDAEEGKGLAGLFAIPGVSLVKVMDHRFTSRDKPETAAPPSPASTVNETVAEVQGSVAGQANAEETEGDRIRREHAEAEAAAEAEESEGGHAVGIGADQAEATEAAASGRKRR